LTNIARLALMPVMRRVSACVIPQAAGRLADGAQ
jgi:hypothetical protein